MMNDTHCKSEKDLETEFGSDLEDSQINKNLVEIKPNFSCKILVPAGSRK